MKKILTITIILFTIQLARAQVYTKKDQFFTYYLKKPSYFGSDSIQVKKELFEYLYRLHYNAKWVHTDSSIELEITHDSTQWVIYSSFYFDSTAKCYAYTNERCDSFGIINLQNLLKHREYNWIEINTNKYLSNFLKSELLEVQYDDNCVISRRTKLQLTRKQYKRLKAGKDVKDD